MAVVKTAADEFSAEIYNFVAGCCKGICLCAASGENKFAVFYCKRFDKRQFSGVDSSVFINCFHIIILLLSSKFDSILFCPF
ncbi:hypothetical protein, partial [Acidaminococcus fermentans]|uniref:hypothetical protein n=1 Tax=Acidaminococcus fermentans TaxID=905 RepID=UPI00307855C3